MSATPPTDPQDPSEPQPEGVSPEPQPEPAPPLLRILTPGATDEEIAALVAVVSALAGSGEAAAKPPTPEWSAPHRLLRPTHRSGPGGWRSSGMP
ncbi:MAG: acyl-CoA carboxylase subunit epsilon [Marmoricola sp.]